MCQLVPRLRVGSSRVNGSAFSVRLTTHGIVSIEAIPLTNRSGEHTMKKVVAALIAATFATVAFAQDKKAADTKPYSPTPPAAAPAKDAAPAKKDAAPTAAAAPAAKSTKSTKEMTAEEKKAAKEAKAAKSKARSDKTQAEIKQDTKKP